MFVRAFATALAVAIAASLAGAPLAPPARAESAAEIEAKADAALERLYREEPKARDLAKKSVAILIFPEIVKGGFIVGGEYGEGVLKVHGKTSGYYSIAAASFGFQAGGQKFSYAMFFLSESALDYLRETEGFELGVGPTLVGGDQGWSSSLGTNDLQGDIAPVFFGQQGLMAGGGIQGSKISRIDR